MSALPLAGRGAVEVHPFQSGLLLIGQRRDELSTGFHAAILPARY